MASIISNYDTPGNSYGITIVGNYAYIADGDKGLQILDISNPKLPKLIGNYLIPNKSSAYEVVVAGNYAYIAADTEGVFVINISNPAQPTLANTYRSRGIAAKDIYVVGNTLYVAESTGYFAIVDIIDIERIGNIVDETMKDSASIFFNKRCTAIAPSRCPKQLFKCHKGRCVGLSVRLSIQENK
ncbi:MULTISPECIES: LVIVD repeat-containing protein [Nostoc]|uniref:LVIVD repeat protein n=1 Tax=Nostoc paludosum FACHB-159 TaxID=2692908 RepID=A0ABR8K8H6_9NOSO|nr:MULTISPECIES: hypothetical protein [Nostoc]MBD2676642.1 hypothetical protein [Nostoc sp. FACHB-857]MBD2735121.1 hypothetical protein [Nostoc paludosum FACHB-159]